MASKSCGCVANCCHHCLGYCMCLGTQTEGLEEGMEEAMGIRRGGDNVTRAVSGNAMVMYSLVLSTPK